jgi:CRP-like cAMP-binding protein
VDSPEPDRLALIPLFAGLSHEQLTRLAGWMEMKEYDIGQSPIRASQHGYAFFVLDEGRARAELDGHVLETLEPGDVFGEMAFFAPNSRRNATVVAETPIRVLSMFGMHFRMMQTEMPDVAARLERVFDERAARMSAGGDT